MKVFTTISVVFLLTLVVLFTTKKFSEKPIRQLHSPIITPEITQEEKKNIDIPDIFVPYWSGFDSTSDFKNYNNLIYFGISANENGVDQGEDGYKNLQKFIQSKQKNNTILALRLLSQQGNEKILHNTKLQQKIITDTLSIASKNNFKGIFLDFEFSALQFTDVVDMITSFINEFGQRAHEDSLQFDVGMYGDSFYRARPFVVSNFIASTDKIFVMAYDFHKAKGNPGANFPLYKKTDEDYDFVQMVTDFQKQVPPEKLVIVYGLFGYDWTIGEKGNSTKQAVSISLAEANKEFLQTCEYKNCKVTKDPASKEIEVRYTDADDKNHDVWFETIESMDIKNNFLLSKGLSQTALWAYSYY